MPGQSRCARKDITVRIAPGCRETLRQIGDNEYYAFLT
ncbi:hypothetical protein ATN83_2362 [Raoultella ornithinolytica]|nr:hypothetical protein ATN83_2362 [Raoultella ornithinolytica]KDV97375.1 hypothetical protein AB00_5556 [Raoultella ornithinolytica 2-156-04_S1_C1]KDX07720.1 hypothetical protein AB28_5624 [Raoultella ornithinolytica 2-156-04_S1_C2]